MTPEPLDAWKPQALRKSSRIAAAVLGSLSVLMLPIVLHLEGGDRWFALTSCVVCAAVFLYAAWSGTSPVFLDHPEVILKWAARKFKRG